MDDEDECSVCLSSCVQPVRLTHCRHVFCRPCILEWGVDHVARCPLCRAPIMDPIYVRPDAVAFSPFYSIGLVVDLDAEAEVFVVSSSLGAGMAMGVRYGDRIAMVDGCVVDSLDELLDVVESTRREERMCILLFERDALCA